MCWNWRGRIFKKNYISHILDCSFPIILMYLLCRFVFEQFIIYFSWHRPICFYLVIKSGIVCVLVCTITFNGITFVYNGTIIYIYLQWYSIVLYNYADLFSLFILPDGQCLSLWNIPTVHNPSDSPINCCGVNNMRHNSIVIAIRIL